MITKNLPASFNQYCSIVMYADNSVLRCKITKGKLEVSAYISINVVSDYCKVNDIVLNETKTIRISFGKDDGVSYLPELLSIVKTTLV